MDSQRIERDGETTYTLPPPMAGFFEFSMMRLRGDVGQKVLEELFYQYLNVEEEFIRSLFVRGETQLGRAFVHGLDYEHASEIIHTASQHNASCGADGKKVRRFAKT